jgi:hypothetical protein
MNLWYNCFDYEKNDQRKTLWGGLSTHVMNSPLGLSPHKRPNFKHMNVLTQILYINSVSLSVRQSVEVLKPRSLLIKLSPRTRGPKNYSGPQVLTSYFYFTSVFVQQLPLSMGEVFLGFGGWVRRFGCVFFGLRV